MKTTHYIDGGVPSEVLKEVKQLRQFYIRFCIYLCVIGGLLLINLIVTPHVLWVVFPALGWGLGIAINWIVVFSPIEVFGEKWEAKAIRKRMAKV